MKSLKLILVGTFAVLLLLGCTKDEEDKGDDEAYYASIATISSDSRYFTATDDGGELCFETAGGSVTFVVNCRAEWIAETTANDLFPMTVSSSFLTITASQNTVEKELTGTIDLMTAGRRIPFATIIVSQNAYGAPEISLSTNEWRIPAVGNLTTEIGVEASAEWIAEADDQWVTIEKTASSIILTASENEEITERETKVAVTCTDGVSAQTEYISVVQDGAAYINVSAATVYFNSTGGTSSVTVESNFDWDYSYEESNGWFTATRNGDSLTVSATENERDDDRNGTITLSAGDGNEILVEMELQIFQYASEEGAMILTYHVLATNTTIHIPLYGTVDCTVDWGDGSAPEKITSVLPAHSFATVGDYDVIIRGTVTALNYYDYSEASDPLRLSAVKQWGKTGLTDMTCAFICCGYLTSLPETTEDAFAEVTSFYAAFYGCERLEKLPETLFENCPKVGDFFQTFAFCYSLKTIPSKLFAGCTNATSFYGTFLDCTALEEIPAGLFDSCQEAVDLRYVFYECISLKTIPSGLFDNCTKAESIEAAFYYCLSLEEIPAHLLDNLPLVTYYGYLFHSCESLKKIPEDLFEKCTNATSFAATFYNCSALEEIPAGLFEKCTGVTSFAYTFMYCSSLTKIPEGLFDSNTKVTSFHATFSSCTSLIDIPEKVFANCPSVTDFTQAFGSCSALKTVPENLFVGCTKVTTFMNVFRSSGITEVPEGLFANCTNVTSFEYAFRQCTSLEAVPPKIFSNNLKVTNFSNTFYGDTALTGESPYDEIDEVKVHLYERANYPEVYTAPTSYGSCFWNCTGLSDYNVIPSGWGGGSSTNSISGKSSSDTEMDISAPMSTPKLVIPRS